MPTEGAAVSLPLMQHTGSERAALDGQLRQAVASWPSRPARATAEVWAALWRVAQLAPSEPDEGPSTRDRRIRW
ncbi:hypothetical protein ACFQZC_02810 [Streptacidiphilus monticola]